MSKSVQTKAPVKKAPAAAGAKEYAIAALPAVTHTLILRGDHLKSGVISDDVAKQIAASAWIIGEAMAAQEGEA